MEIAFYGDPLQTKRIFGIGSVLRKILKYLSFRPILLLLRGMGSFEEKKYKIKYYGLGFNKPKPIKLLNKIIAHNQIANEKFDILYWPHQQIYFFKKPKSKFVFTLHDLIPLIFPQWHSKFIVNFDFKIMLKKALNYADKIVCVSKTTKNDLIRFYGEKYGKKAIVIYNGIDHNLFYPRKQKEVEIIREKFGITKEYILYTGGFHPRKNVETLIKAFDLIKEKVDIQLVLTGEGLGVFRNFDEAYYSSKFKEDIKVLGFLNEKDLPALYSGALLYINPSLYEGFGLGPLESLACGTPVVVSNIPTTKELMPQMPKFGALNYRELAEKVIDLLNNESKREELIKIGIQIAKKYDWKRTALKYNKILTSYS